MFLYYNTHNKKILNSYKIKFFIFIINNKMLSKIHITDKSPKIKFITLYKIIYLQYLKQTFYKKYLLSIFSVFNKTPDLYFHTSLA